MKTPRSTKNAERGAAEQGKREFTGTELLALVPVKTEPRVDSRLLATATAQTRGEAEAA